ncbi:MAG: aminotransferase class V-fold PLP-dependent enzyme [Deltaproteobacteria bacterium]|jgi:cysteine desulfurase family protein|nr:aminotransferase class V-fold PLP-dependent enzyme [Deltaproteobacteria bacterium]
MIYLDNGATSFPKPPGVSEAVARALANPASPGRSGHKPALEASRIVFRARKKLAGILGKADPERMVFTPNITWALNAAIKGIPLEKGAEVISTALEHNSTARPLRELEKAGAIVWKKIHPRENGLIEAADLLPLLSPRTKLLVLNHASNVTGALTPVEKMRRLCPDVPLILDAAQTAGAYPLEDFARHADVVCLTGHKGLLGPTGTGGLWIRPGVDVRPLAVGGSGSNSESLEHPDFLPDALEAGTLNTHGLAGLAAALDYLEERGIENIRRHELDLAGVLLGEAEGISGLRILGPSGNLENRVATVSVTLEGYSSSDLSSALESGYGIMTRAGLHCAPLAHEASGTFPGGATRFSFGPFNTPEDALAAAAALRELSGKRRAV